MNNKSINLNTDYYKNQEENFNQAYELFEKQLSKSELIEILKNGNVVQKQVSALKLNCIESVEDATVLTHNLTGQDGKIREAVSLKINEFLHNPEFAKYFQTYEIYDIFMDAIIDVNGNICRNIISAIANLKNNIEFCKYFTDKLVNLTIRLTDKIKDFNFQDGKYKINKEVFKLYWCLEVMYEFSDCIKLDDLKRIVRITKDINEYTIREKTAKILSKEFSDNELKTIRNELKADENYYVRRF